MKTDRNPPRRIDEILGNVRTRPDLEPPESRKQACSLCHLDFLSRPQWFDGWKYPNICVYCGDNYSHNEEVRSGGMVTYRGKHLSPRTELDSALASKKFYCPASGHLEKVEPVKEGAYWAYNGKCVRCGVIWVNIYYAYKRKDKTEHAETVEDPDDD